MNTKNETAPTVGQQRLVLQSWEPGPLVARLDANFCDMTKGYQPHEKYREMRALAIRLEHRLIELENELSLTVDTSQLMQLAQYVGLASYGMARDIKPVTASISLCESEAPLMLHLLQPQDATCDLIIAIEGHACIRVSSNDFIDGDYDFWRMTLAERGLKSPICEAVSDAFSKMKLPNQTKP